MGQIISAFYNFINEYVRSGDRYKTRRTKNRSWTVIVIAIGVAGAWAFVKGFGMSYQAHADVVRIKQELAVVKETNRQLFESNSRLEIRNEILSQTLTSYLGSGILLQLNGGKLPDKPALDPDTVVMPMPNSK